jgi:hypothetical protein
MHIASVFVFKFFVFANKNDTRKQRFLQYKYLNLFNIFALLGHRFQHPLMVNAHAYPMGNRASFPAILPE